MKNLFIIEESERNRILGMHETATKNQYLNESELDEQLGAGVKAGLSGLGQRVKTTAQNLRTAMSPTRSGDRITDSPKLNAALARVKSRAGSLQKVVTDLNTDLDEITTNANQFAGNDNPFRFEAQQLLELTKNFKTALEQVSGFNTQLANFQFQKPELTAPTQTSTTTTAPASTTTAAPSASPASPAAPAAPAAGQ